MASVEVHDEVVERFPNGYMLAFQRCTYHYEEEQPSEQGYRFIWKTPEGRLKPQRGQARIPSAEILQRLTEAANKAGWLR